MINDELSFTLEEAVKEVLGMLTGLELTYVPEQDRFRNITRQLNRAMRSMALEQEWSYYSSTEVVGVVAAGDNRVYLPSSLRPRIINDDAVTLTDEDGATKVWAYFLPRDALHKVPDREGLWCAVTRNEITFSRRFHRHEDGLQIRVPVMREPVMFRLPSDPTDADDADEAEIPDEILQQEIDFAYPDVVILRAAFYYAQTDPVMQPRVQTLEAQYKDLMYQIIERDARNTDAPLENTFVVPVTNSIAPEARYPGHYPYADERG